MSHAYGNQRGTSLVELLTSTLFVAILTGMSYSFARAALMSARVQEVKSEAQEVTVMALDFLARDVRMAGFSAAAKSVTAVQGAGDDFVLVATDLNGDGDSADANELISYQYSAEKRQLVRATGDASPQPLVRNVPPGGVAFAFYDATGARIATGGRTMAAEDRGRIHRIDVRLRVELPNPDPTVAAPLTSMLSSSICLRNQ